MEESINHNIGVKVFFLFISIGLFYMCSNSPKEVNGHLNGLEDKQTITFEAKQGQKLSAKLTTPEPGNIRFNQVISPSGESDGPYGQDIRYEINETGIWKLIVGGSLMQGDSYNGDFTVKIDLE